MQSYGTLWLLRPEGEEQPFALSAPSVTIGRASSNDIALHDDGVAEGHARLTFDGHVWRLVDLNTLSGTFINDVRIERAQLAPGQVIRLGASRLRFESQPAPQVPAMPPPAAPTSEAPPAARDRKRVGEQFIKDFLKNVETVLPDEAASSAPLGLPWKEISLPHLVVHTLQKIWELPLARKEAWTIGRDPSCDVYLEHIKVSRFHARIERRGDAFLIRDLGSANGTWVGSQRINEHALRHADTVSIGNARLVFKGSFTANTDIAPAKKGGRSPVVIVPGTMGSELWRGDERVWPSVRTLLLNPDIFALPDEVPLEARDIVGEVVIVPKLFKLEEYNRLGNFLEENLGYTRGKDLIEFAYDWRQDMRLTAQQLAARIDAWAVSEPITIIAHSQGCLLSRYYVEALGGKRNVGRLVLIGGPNYGAPNTLIQMLPADKLDLLSGVMALGGMLGKKFIAMNGTFPSMYEFLPTYPCIADQSGQPIDLFTAQWLPKDKLPLLQSGREFMRQIGSRASVPTICIFGYGFQTVNGITIERDADGSWTSLEANTANDGDGTVPSASSVLQGAEIHPVHQEHNSLYVDSDVLMRLQLELVR